MKKILSLLMLILFIGACKKTEADKPETPPVTPGSSQDKSLITWSVDGANYAASGVSLYSPSVDKIGVSSNTEDDKYNIQVVFKGNKEGQFKMGNTSETGKASIVFQNAVIGKEYQNTYVADCRQGGFVYTEGEVIITRVGKPGDYVEGTFSATLYDSEHCTSKEHVKVKGTFKALRAGGE